MVLKDGESFSFFPSEKNFEPETSNNLSAGISLRILCKGIIAGECTLKIRHRGSWLWCSLEKSRVFLELSCFFI